MPCAVRWAASDSTMPEDGAATSGSAALPPGSSEHAQPQIASTRDRLACLDWPLQDRTVGEVHWRGGRSVLPHNVSKQLLRDQRFGLWVGQIGRPGWSPRRRIVEPLAKLETSSMRDCRHDATSLHRGGHDGSPQRRRFALGDGRESCVPFPCEVGWGSWLVSGQRAVSTLDPSFARRAGFGEAPASHSRPRLRGHRWAHPVRRNEACLFVGHQASGLLRSSTVDGARIVPALSWRCPGF